MALELTTDELREVCMAITAYRQALDQQSVGAGVSEVLGTLNSARRKVLAEWDRMEKERRPALVRTSGAA